MKCVWGSVVVVFTIIFSLNSAHAVGDLSFAERWESEIGDPGSTLKVVIRDPASTQEISIRDLLQTRHVLFVAGIMNEIAHLVNSYYYHQIREAENGLKMTVSYYGPSSRVSMSENADHVYQEILRVYKVNKKKPMVLIGHSKGASEIFYAILRHPELIWDGTVERVFLLQAAIHGSPLVSEGGNKFPMNILSHLFLEGWQSLEQNHAEKELLKELSNYQSILEQRYGEFGEEAMAKMHRKIHKALFWAKSFQVESSICWPMRAILELLRGNLYGHGKNDALVLTEQMKCDQLGHDLGEVRTDHIAPVVSLGLPEISWLPWLSKVQTGSSEEQSAFLRAALGQVYDQRKKPPVDSLSGELAP
jgi:predicted hydrocarbon binding protein